MGELNFMQPTEGTISSTFKKDRKKEDKVTKEVIESKHWGIDYAAPKGTPVKASERGVVMVTYQDVPGYGKLIIIDHAPKAEEDEQHIYTLYAHLDSISVREGESVEINDTIGAVGHTGRSTSKPGNEPDHLHFEVFDTPWEAEIIDILKKDGRAREHRENPTGYIGQTHKLNGTLGDLTDKEAEYLINDKISYRLLDISRMAVLVDGRIESLIDENNKSVTVILKYDEKELEKLMAGPMPPPKKHAPLNVDISIQL
ncbi:MAG: M23 family metallopeptidase [Thermodesulfobacteriota bacterium]